MRKFLLLCTSLLFSFAAISQKDTVFYEDFDAPSGPDQVTSGMLSGPGSISWNDTNLVYTSPNMSYHVKGNLANQFVYFETDPFSTVGKPFVWLSFNQIAKVYLNNQARVQISTDGGQTWSDLRSQHYMGNDPTFQYTNYFNAGSHADENNITPWRGNQPSTPTNSWWVEESFHLTGVASDTTTTPMSGYPDVRLRFLMEFRRLPPVPPGFLAGWFVDDITVTAGPCEVTPPTFEFDYVAAQCYPKPPEGAIVARPDSVYPIGLRVRDNRTRWDMGVDTVAFVYRVNGGQLDTVFLPYDKAEDQYIDSLAFSMGDTVEYYYLAWDESCPNMGRYPGRFENGGFNQFYIEFNMPPKCGSANCGKYPEVIKGDTTWLEDFDDLNRWEAATASNPRGSFPFFPDGAWTVAPPPANNPYFGWTVRSGPTPTNFTGPDGDHTLGVGGGGQYVHLEIPTTTSVQGNNVTSRLNTPCIDMTRVTSCKAFEFYYHMFGEDIGNLFVQVDSATNSQGTNWVQVPIFRVQGEQQSSGTDSWERAIIPLEAFNGKIIRLSIIAQRKGADESYGPRGDIAVDDLRIYEPDPVEFEALETSYPINGYCAYSTNEPVMISIRNNGCNTATEIPVAYSVNGGTPVRDTIRNVNIPLGSDTIDYSISPGVSNLNLPGFYDIAVWVEAPGDADRSNDTVYAETIEVTHFIDDFPYFVDFDDADPTTNTLSNNEIRLEDGLDPNFFWTVGTEMTPTRETGPFRGHGFGGNYLHVENNGSSAAVSTYVRTICVDLGSLNSPVLDFLYHNYTSNSFDKLEVEVSMGDEDLNTWSPVPNSTVSSTAGFNSEFSDWKLKRVDLAPVMAANPNNSSAKLRFKATRTSNSGDEVDFAIDNLGIYDPLSQDAGVLNIKVPPLHGTKDTMMDPEITVINYGTSSFSNFTVNLEVTPLCGPNQGQSTTYSQSYSTSVPSLQTTQVTMDSPNIDWPETECRVCFSTDVAGDTYAFNDTVCKNIVVRPAHPVVTSTVTTEGFSDNFDDCNYSKTGFYADGGFMQWELGTPTFGPGPHTTPNAWVTNLDGPFLPGTTEYLYLPRFHGFDTIVKVDLRFFQRFNFGGGSEGVFDAAGAMEFYDANDNTYKVLGGTDLSFSASSGNPQRGTQNWYLSQYGSRQVDLFNGQPSWVNTTHNNYIYSRFSLGEFNRFPGILDLRYTFKSKSMPPSQASFGWAIDGFSFYVPPQNSVSPINVHVLDKPVAFPNEEQRLLLRVRNTGAKIVDSFKVDVYIDGVHMGSQTRVPSNAPLFEGRVETFEFDHPWPANMVTPGPHDLCVITSRPNAKRDNYQPDDTLCMNVPVLQEYDLTSNGDPSYCNDFEEDDPTQFRWITSRMELYSQDTTSWEDGFPLLFDSAHSGFFMWMTKLEDYYPNMDQSVLYTPLFHLDSAQTYKLDFWHQFFTEKFHDGGNIEYSFDGGANWYYLGWTDRTKDEEEQHWYNTSFVTALDQVKPGWTDSSGGWINSWMTFSFAKSVDVVFRYRFGSDYSTQYPGWAIDDFCLAQDTGNAILPEMDNEEYVLPDAIAIGELAPNPASDKTEIPFHFPSRNSMDVKVYNVVGQLIESRSSEYQEGVHVLTFDTSRWKNGIYLINLEYGDGQSVTKKLVVSH